MNVVLLIVGILLFFGLVVIHELGHFFAARKGGVDVLEFGVGFPPQLFKRRMKGGWLLTINLLPLGGFVKLKGEHDVDDEPGSLGAASVGTKTAIMLAGVTMNLLAAYVLFLVLAFVGLPQLIDNQFIVKSDATYVARAQPYVGVGQVIAGSPAAEAGIKANDVLVSLTAAGRVVTFTNADALPEITRQYAGQPVLVTYRQGSVSGNTATKSLTLLSNQEVQKAKAAGQQEGPLGVEAFAGQQGATIIRSTWSAPIVAAGVIEQFTVLTFQDLGKALAGVGSIVAGTLTRNTAARQAGQEAAASQVAGPVGVFFVFKYGSALGLRFIVLIVAILSLTLAIMNVLPVPALDGGRLWLTLITRAFRRPLKPEHEEAINAAGFALLMGLMILITVVDVRRFF